jgi:hypothetical protein
MNVVTSIEINAADAVWFDATSGRLFIRSNAFVNGIDLSRMSDEDFESRASIRSFSLGQSGGVVVCHHTDGAETWLPVDMWEPGGFTPSPRRRATPRARTKSVARK